MPNAKSSAEEFEFPQYSSSPRYVFSSVADAMELCFKNHDIDYRFYWHNKKNIKPEHAMLFFLKDGALIYGFSTDASDAKYINELLLKLESLIESDVGLVTWEFAPDVNSYDEFRKVVLENET